jgi:hypothetical protein
MNNNKRSASVKLYSSEKYDTVKDKNKGSCIYPCYGTDDQIYKQQLRIRKLLQSRNKLYRAGRDLNDIDIKINKYLDDINDLKNADIDRHVDDKLKLNVITEAPDLDLKPDESSTIAIFGSSKRGKSTLMVKIWERYYKNDAKLCTILISPSSHIGLFKNMKGVIKINKFNQATTKLIKDIMRIQNKTDNAYKFLFLIDDCVNNKYNEMLNNLFLVMRNHNVSSIISLQYCKLLSIQARGSAHRCIAFSQNNYEATTSLLNSFFLSELRKITGIKKIEDVAQEYMDLTQEGNGHAFFTYNPFSRDLKRYVLKL